MPNWGSLNNKLLRALNFKGYPIAVDTHSVPSKIKQTKAYTRMYIVRDMSLKGKASQLLLTPRPQEVTKFLAEYLKQRNGDDNNVRVQSTESVCEE